MRGRGPDVVGSLLALVAALWTASFAFEARASQMPDNVPLDTDGNGLYDRVRVTDWDGDGVLEMSDVQAAVDALTDPGPKYVRVGPGDFRGPDPRVGHALALPSRIVLEGSGQNQTILRGFGAADLTSTGAVISNADHASGNSEITITQLTVDGGWGSADATGFSHARMGIFLTHCDDCRVQFVTVRDTLHSCLYSSNGHDVHFDDNTLERCGNVLGQGARYPCVYLFASPGAVQHGVWVSHNTCVDSGAAALNTRRGNAAAVLGDVHFSHNVVSTTPGIGAPAECMSLTGVDGGIFTDNTCLGTGPVSYGATDYYSAGTDPSSARWIDLDGLVIQPAPGKEGLRINGHLENSSFRRVQVLGSPGSACVSFLHPFRDVVFEDLDLRQCGTGGIREANDLGMGTTSLERLTFRNVKVGASSGPEIEGPALLFQGAVENLTIEGLEALRVAGNGIEMRGDVSWSAIRDSSLRQLGGAGIVVGPGAVVDGLEISGNTIEDAADHGILLATDGGGSGESIVIGDNTVRDCCAAVPASVIRVSGPMTGLWVGENLIEDDAGAALYGVELDVSGDEPSSVCTNHFTGAFTSANRYLVAGHEAAYRDDADGDDSVDACDCAPSDPAVYPGAMELNDGKDNNCPNDGDYAIVDETSGDSGFHNSDNKSVYSWPAQPGALAYRVVRSTEPTFQFCYATVRNVPWLLDGGTPPAGGCYYYLNRALGPFAGSWGTDSGGSERAGVCGEL